ncbi:unnamed protein product [Periconia digitata]|uniref:Uncharacterized protein n=1 Tax=Periconia digitata TaxID=1303443 RepID=A0A9W4UPD1_9PLEO|nr:unnamed protein product [Periconia digitata]
MPDPLTFALGAGVFTLGYKAVRKVRKHHHEKEARKYSSQLTAAETQSVNADVRQVTRHFTRSIAGEAIAGPLSFVLPHMTLPAGINLYIFRKARQDWKQLSAHMRAKGATVRKRDVARGIGRALVEKAVLVPITLGHDDFLLAVPQGEGSSLLEGHEALLNVPLIGGVNSLVQAPVEGFQHELGIQTSEERVAGEAHGVVDIGGWSAPAKDIAADVGIVGTVAAATEYVIDRPLEYREGRLQSVG